MKTGNGAVRGIGRNDDLRVSGRYERGAEVRNPISNGYFKYCRVSNHAE